MSEDKAPKATTPETEPQQAEPQQFATTQRKSWICRHFPWLNPRKCYPGR